MKAFIAVLTLVFVAAAYANTAYMPRPETEKCLAGLEKQIDIMDNKVDLILEHVMDD